MDRDRVPVLASLLLLAASATVAFGGQSVSAADIAKEIRAKGANATLRSLVASPSRWAAALERISKGDPRWLEIAASLYPASDGGSADELQLAVADALEHRPADVLRVLGRPFGVEVVCGNEESIGREFNEALAIIARRRATLVAVGDESLRQEKESCLAALDSLADRVRKHRKDWFGEK
jgi:hypothetical protein